ncbi:hypothetical protein WA026_005758 [Henosepilachna vigintioctopunctata]|uniref:Uncharacterized protein n=1 Tax=Henosepilachna vigintioctopunctata TaxID=420089 RepID=A0AAW1U317_9CUCU
MISIFTVYPVFLCLIASVVGNTEQTTATELADVDNVVPCSVRQFSCKNNKCIPILFFCDGDKDCEDGTDEDVIVCSNAKNLTCASSEFKCEANGNCIPNHWQCDGAKKIVVMVVMKMNRYAKINVVDLMNSLAALQLGSVYL